MNQDAEELKRLIFERTGIEAHRLSCPRDKSDMTPCVARDGWTAATEDGKCVGCGEDIADLLAIERKKHS